MSNSPSGTNQPQNDPAKPMDSQREVSQSPDAKIEQDFQGYPRQAGGQGGMEQNTAGHHTDAKLEDDLNEENSTGVSQRYGAGNEGTPESTKLAATDSRSEEIGKPQNLGNEDLRNGDPVPNSSGGA